MADAQLQILIKARNEAKKEFDKLNQQVNTLKGSSGGLNKTIGELDNKFRSVTGMSLGFATAAGAAGAAVTGLVKFLTDAVNETVAYATEIDNMSRLLGLSTEETSRLVQASDDLFVSTETLTTAMQAASRKGIDTSIEGLKKLSGQYLELNPGVERAKFLMDNFGRSGAEMGKLMEIGADGIDSAMAAIDDSLVVTKQSMAATIAYKQSVDNLSDTWQGFKYTIGQELIPALDLLMRAMTAGVDPIEAQGMAVEKLKGKLTDLNVLHELGWISAEKYNEKLKLLTAQIDWAAGSFQRGGVGANAFYQGLVNAYTGASNLLPTLSGLDNLISPLTESFRDLTAEMIFNKVAGDLDADAQLELARSMGLINEGTYSAITALQDASDEFKQSQDEEHYLDVIKGIYWHMTGLPPGGAWHYSFTYDYYYNEHGTKPNPHGSRDPSVGAGGTAIGGPVRGGQPYIVGEVGRELFIPDQPGTIIPNNQLRSGGGGNTVINFNYSPAVSLSDRTEMETRILPLMRRLMARV